MSYRLFAVVLMVFMVAVQAWAQEAPERVTEGLVVLYDFSEWEGDVVGDKSGVGMPLDLRINDPNFTFWLAGGGPEIFGEGIVLQADHPPTKLLAALQATNEFTIEADVVPKDLEQGGPARIVSLSLGTGARNFTLGQEKTQYIFRLRTSELLPGTPEVKSDENYVEPVRQHVAVTYADGRVRLYVDGEVVHEAKRPGDLSNWDAAHAFVVANETTLDRSWQGQLFLVAVYDRALTGAEIKQNYAARLLPLAP